MPFIQATTPADYVRQAKEQLLGATSESDFDAIYIDIEGEARKFEEDAYYEILDALPESYEAAQALCVKTAQ